MRAMIGLVVAMVLLLPPGPWPTSVASADTPEFQYQRGAQPPLEVHRTYRVAGKRVGIACAYQYPTFSNPPGVAAWEVRDIGIDTQRCIKLVVEGVPTSLTSPSGDSSLTSSYRSRAGRGAPTSRVPGQQRPLLATRATGFTDVWWEDVVGALLTRDRTYVTWEYNGTCATGGATDGFWEWQAGTGWYLYASGGSNTTNCSYHLGETNSEFRNPSFCSPDTVFTNYYYVQFRGYYDGSYGGSSSSDTIYECAPVYRYGRVVRTS